ncbi:MAG: hypothetical protein U1E78_02145 [Gammaproteobacteria bacterium]
MHNSPHPKKILRLPPEPSAVNQDVIVEVIQPKSPSLELLNQRWQKIRLLILQELADQSSRG